MSIEGVTQGPSAYAQHLARYIKDASRIEALTKREYGRAPARSDITRYIEHNNRPRRLAWENNTIGRRPTTGDGEHFKVTGLVKASKRKAVVPVEAPKEEQEFVLPEIPADLLPQERILFGVARDFMMQPSDITGQKRHPRYIDARVVVIRLLRERNPKMWSYIKLGQFLGGRDHSTIINALLNWDIYAKRNPLVVSCYERMRQCV